MIKTNVYAFLLMLFIFMTPIYYCLTTALQIPPNFLGPLVAVFTVIVIFLYLFSKWPFERKEMVCFLLLMVFGFVFYSTRIKFGHDNEFYITRFDGWLSLGNSSVLAGMLLTKKYKNSLYDKMMEILPLIILFVTAIVVPRILFGQDSNNGQFIDEFGLDYQSNAYYMALMFALSAYYIFIHTPTCRQPKKTVRAVLLVLMVIHIVFCAMAGGRGGFLLLIVYAIIFAWHFMRNRIITTRHLLLIILAGIVLFLIFANSFDLSNSSGFERSLNYSEQKRTDVWITYIPIILDDLWFGHGLGSVFYVSDYYAHNLIIDMVVETGVIGTVIIMFIYTMVYISLVKKSKKDPLAYFVLILFVYQFVFNFFSSYWIDSSLNWIAFGFVISYKFPQYTRSTI